MTLVPNLYEVTLTFLLGNGDVAQNVLHFDSDTPLLVESFEALANAVFDSLSSVIGRLAADTVLKNIRVGDLGTDPVTTRDFPFDQEGGGGTATLPHQLAVVASLHADHPGRSGRGRIYFGPFSEVANDDTGTVSSDTRDAVATTVNEFIDGYVVDGANLSIAVYSRKDGVGYIVDNVTVDSRWDVQRRRANRRLF